jgi:hypothetical protein
MVIVPPNNKGQIGIGTLLHEDLRSFRTMQLHIPASKFEIDVVQEAGCLPEYFIFPDARGKRSHHGGGRKAVLFSPASWT